MTIAEMIVDWHAKESAGLHYQESRKLQDSIETAILSAPRPWLLSWNAWMTWIEYENVTEGYNFHHAMDLCAFAEWAAETECGLTTEPFTGVPRIVITTCQN